MMNTVKYLALLGVAMFGIGTIAHAEKSITVNINNMRDGALTRGTLESRDLRNPNGMLYATPVPLVKGLGNATISARALTSGDKHPNGGEILEPVFYFQGQMANGRTVFCVSPYDGNPANIGSIKLVIPKGNDDGIKSIVICTISTVMPYIVH